MSDNQQASAVVPSQSTSAEELVQRSAACVETRTARNTCVTEKGQENCKEVIEAHRECMRKMGFSVN